MDKEKIRLNIKYIVKNPQDLPLYNSKQIHKIVCSILKDFSFYEKEEIFLKELFKNNKNVNKVIEELQKFINYNDLPEKNLSNSWFQTLNYLIKNDFIKQKNTSIFNVNSTWNDNENLSKKEFFKFICYQCFFKNDKIKEEDINKYISDLIKDYESCKYFDFSILNNLINLDNHKIKQEQLKAEIHYLSSTFIGDENNFILKKMDDRNYKNLFILTNDEQKKLLYDLMKLEIIKKSDNYCVLYEKYLLEKNINGNDKLIIKNSKI